MEELLPLCERLKNENYLVSRKKDADRPHALPQFLDRAERLQDVLRGMAYGELKRLWKCNDQIAALNVERLRDMDLRHALTRRCSHTTGLRSSICGRMRLPARS